MTRPLRLEFAGALYHVTSRGNRNGTIFRDDRDRRVWLAVLGTVCERCNFIVHAFCQMTNHYHLVVETIDGNLADGMRELNGIYSSYFNRRHAVVGHLFQGRYYAVLVQKESHLLELSRYVVLNPVRAGIVALPQEWHWSSYHYYLKDVMQKPAWLETAWFLGQFGNDPANARDAYIDFVLAGRGLLNPLRNVRHGLLLGNAEHVINDGADRAGIATLDGIARVQRKLVALSLDDYAKKFPERDEAMAQAHRSTVYSMREIAIYFGTSARTVSRAINRCKS